jgi:endonuclease YncB( thermonuclease family)
MAGGRLGRLRAGQSVAVEDSGDGADEPATFASGGEGSIMMMGKWTAVAGLAALVAGGALAEVPASVSVVIDGDTVLYKGAEVHLWGIDAPEKRQTCTDGWQAGKISTAYLAGLIHNRRLVCDVKPSPVTPGQTYALCKVDGQDLSAALVEAGMAWSYAPQTEDYTVQESNAMIAVLGVHAHDCMKAWDWRIHRQQLRP